MKPQSSNGIQSLPYLQGAGPVSSRKEPVNLVDLFAGIGGFHYGVEAAAAERGRRVIPVLVSEIDEDCQETYLRNHGVQPQGDIRNLDIDDGVVADILTAGFPCQPFSNSGLKRGLSDPRGQFYESIKRLIISYQAKSFILENVPGIRMNGGSHRSSRLSVPQGQKIGRTMQILESKLSQLSESHDYEIKWVELDSSHFGSPQVRKRVYIVGIKRDFGKTLDLNFVKAKPHSFYQIREGRTIPELELSPMQEKNLRSFISPLHPPSYKDGMRRVGQAYLCAGGNVGQGYHAHGLVPTLTKVWARFLPIYFPGQGELLPKLDIPQFKPNAKYGTGYLRRASVREVMRLQGFPDHFIPHKNDTIAYGHAGNAVNALVVKAIAERLLQQINK